MHRRGSRSGRAVVIFSMTACASYNGAPGPDAGSDAPVVSQADASADVDVVRDAGTDGPAPCVTLSLASANGGRVPTLAGRANIGGAQLTLLPADGFAFNQSGSATWTFPASTRISGSYELAIGSPVSSGYGDGTALGFYAGAPGATSPALLGLGAGPGFGAFYDSQKSSMSATSRSQLSIGTFTTARGTARSVSIPTPPLNRKITFEITPAKVTFDGLTSDVALGSISTIVLGATCTQENPQGFAVMGFTAQACP